MKKSLKKVVKIGIAIIILIVLGIIGYFTWNFIEVNMAKQEEMEKDETPPTLEIKDLTLTQGKSYNVYSFLENCSDNKSEKCNITFASEEMGSYSEIGTYEIEIIAKDEKENETRQKAALTIAVEGQEQVVETQEEPQQTLPTENARTLITTIDEKSEATENYYGTIKKKIKTTTYNLYSDGTKEYAGETTEEQIDYSGNTTNYNQMEAEVVNQIYATGDILSAVYQEIGPDNVDALNSSIAVYRAMEIGYSNINSDTRPDGRVSSSILEDIEYPKTLYKEIRLTGSRSASEISQVVLTEFATLQSEGYTKIGVGGAIVFDTYYWVIIFTN